MSLLAFEVQGDNLVAVLFEGSKSSVSITSFGKVISVPKAGNRIRALIDFRTNIEMKVTEIAPTEVVICEGGGESGKQRIRMEYLILESCERKEILCHTYPSGSTTKYINTGYEREMGIRFEDGFNKYNLHKFTQKAFAVGWKFLRVT